MRGILLPVIGVALLAGCVTSPQTREELKVSTRNHTSMAIVESHTANRRFEDVAATLQKKWQECYNIQVTTTRKTQSGMTTSRYRDEFHPHARKVNNSLVEMTLRMTTQGMVMLNKVPEGGEYIVALDIVRLPGDKARLDWYSPAWGWKDAWAAAQQWSDGKNAPCPTG